MNRIAASTYLNSAPLIWSFLHGEGRDRVTLIDAVPARCALLLARAEVDAALVPVIEYQRIQDLVVVPDVCVGSKRRVRSVVLASNCDDLKEIRSVALDESSRTSATLVKIIFREFVGHEPAWSTYSPDLQRMLNENDAALIIGDPGMTFSHEGIRVWDMANLWNEQTGLGFVFAMWMVRREAVNRVRDIDFAAARDEGLSRIEEIVRSYESSLGLSAAEIRTYLTENISFRVDNEMGKGLQLYFELAQKHGLISELKELKFDSP
jgi:chorismate dehydratase